MNPKDPNFHRAELESDYWAWSNICEEKHGKPSLLSADDLKQLSDQDLVREVKKLKELARTPRD